MAEEPFQGSGNWWETTPTRNLRFESVEEPQSSSYDDWQQQHQQHHGSSSMVFHGTQKLQTSHDSASTSRNNPNLHRMGLGLSSSTIDWNQASLLRSEKASEGSFRSMLQDNLSTSSNNFHQVNRGFSLEQTQFSPQYSSEESNLTSQSLPCSTFQIDSSSTLFGNPNSMIQGILGQENNQVQNIQNGNSFENRPMNFPYSTSYGFSSNELMSSWSSKVPQILRSSPPKQQPQHSNNQLHFTNNAPFWNALEATTVKDAPSSFFPSLQPPFATTNFDAQTKNISEGRDTSGAVKKSGSEPAPKRPRNETPSSMPAFKVRKEKMGDRITALQQLVSPFGKTDTASVLSEAIEYIKFLHEQVTVLSTPYMKSGGAPIQHQQSSGKSKEDEGPKQDLRSRGLCLVPVSSTFPMTHEPTTVEYWTPTFGGTYR